MSCFCASRNLRSHLVFGASVRRLTFAECDKICAGVAGLTQHNSKSPCPPRQMLFETSFDWLCRALCFILMAKPPTSVLAPQLCIRERPGGSETQTSPWFLNSTTTLSILATVLVLAAARRMFEASIGESYGGLDAPRQLFQHSKTPRRLRFQPQTTMKP